MSREALEEAAASGAGQKAHVIHCPRCRQTIRIPMDQILRALPAGWTPAANGETAATGEAAVTVATAAEAQSGAETNTAATTDLTPEAATASDRSQRRHRHSSKTHTGDSAAVPAAKKSTHSN